MLLESDHFFNVCLISFFVFQGRQPFPLQHLLSFILQVNANSKLLMPSKKGSIYGAVRGCTFLADHGQAVAFSHSRKIGFRGRSHSNDSNLGGSQTCKYLFLVCSWHDLTKVAKGCSEKKVFLQIWTFGRKVQNINEEILVKINIDKIFLRLEYGILNRAIVNLIKVSRVESPKC